MDEIKKTHKDKPTNKKKTKNPKNSSMRELYKEFAKDPRHLNSDGDFYLGDGMVLDQFGNIKEE